MTQYEQEEDKKRNAAKWDKYFDASDVDETMQTSSQNKPEFVYHISREELNRIQAVGGRVIVNIDELTEIKLGKLTFLLPDDFGSDQNNTFHQSVSGVVAADTQGIKAGTRVFFHYMCIVNAKIRQAGGNIIIACDGKSYIVLDTKVIYVGIVDGKPVALHPDFCITEPIERQNWDKNGDYLVKMTSGLITESEKQIAATPYEPLICKIVSLPSTESMEEDRKMAMLHANPDLLIAGTLSFKSLKEGDTVKCRKAWNIPLDNGIQKYLGDRTLFRTRIEAIKEIVKPKQPIQLSYYE